MDYILNAEQSGKADRYSSESVGIPSLVLMERAAVSACEVIENGNYDLTDVLIVCGSGNNGGDGAAIARILFEHKAGVRLYCCGKPEKYSSQMSVQMKICKEIGLRIEEEFKPEGATLLVDAIFGIGLKREISGHYAEVIDRMNECCVPVVSIDMPSGISTDSGRVMGTAVEADATVTFTSLKPGLCLYPGVRYAGSVLVKSAGIQVPDEIKDQCCVYSVNDEDLTVLKEREADGNKGTFGKVLVIAGSHDIFGAAYLASSAAFSTGVGMVKVVTEEANRAAIESLLPEALFRFYRQGDSDFSFLADDLEWADAVLVGPGMGTGQTSVKLFHAFLEANRVCHKDTVLDADALNLLSKEPDLFGEILYPVILTPHVGEMARLTGESIDAVKQDLPGCASAFAKEKNVTCILKDARTVTADSFGNVWINLSGSDALAKAGSGDVLAGITAGCLARFAKGGQGSREFQGYIGAVAAYLHGKCGQRSGNPGSANTALARDIIRYMSEYI